MFILNTIQAKVTPNDNVGVVTPQPAESSVTVQTSSSRSQESDTFTTRFSGVKLLEVFRQSSDSPTVKLELLNLLFQNIKSNTLKQLMQSILSQEVIRELEEERLKEEKENQERREVMEANLSKPAWDVAGAANNLKAFLDKKNISPELKAMVEELIAELLFQAETVAKIEARKGKTEVATAFAGALADMPEAAAIANDAQQIANAVVAEKTKTKEEKNSVEIRLQNPNSAEDIVSLLKRKEELKDITTA